MPNSQEKLYSFQLTEDVSRLGSDDVDDIRMELLGLLTGLFPVKMQFDDETQLRLEPFLEDLARWEYSVWNGPGKDEEKYLKGVNCQFLVHYLLREMFGVELDESMLSLETYNLETAQKYFDEVPISPEMKLNPGDVVMFENDLLRKKTETGEIKDEYGPKYFHMALVCGSDIAGQPILAHMLSFGDKRRKPVALWTIKDFAMSKYHDKIAAIRRPKQLVNTK